MTLSEFVRAYSIRAKNIAWFFGSGSSASAGMPTASDLVWEFKRRIYCSEEGYHLSLFSNLSDPFIRNQIQSYFDGKGSLPAVNSFDEYSTYFELAYPSPIDRSNYLMQQFQGMRNSFGHKVIGVLMKNGLVNLIFTTNFDKAFENAAIDQLKKLDNFFVATTDNADTSIKNYQSGLRPFIAKIHGDYFSDKLKNTSSELKKQDEQLRQILYNSCLSNGMAVLGYSGRDKSVMEIFNSALDQKNSFPSGLFWFIRSGSPTPKEVSSLIQNAKTKGVESELIEIDTFDSTMGEIVKAIPGLPPEDIQQLNTNYYKLSNAQLPSKGSKYPIIRFNAILVNKLPTCTRILKCPEAGNTKEINEVIKSENGKIIAIRKREGIVGFGADSEFERVFSKYGKSEMDVFQIHDNVLVREDSTLKGLLSQCLSMAIVRENPLISIKRRDKYLIIPDPKRQDELIFSNLKKELNTITGSIPQTSLKWIAALNISLQRKLSNDFVVISPTILVSKTENAIEKSKIAPFVKEATAKWYNNKYPKLIDAWLDVIFRDKKQITITSYSNDIIGFNPEFVLTRESALTKSF